MHKIKAFTLIEILIVVAIVGVLSGIVVISMSDSQERARIAKSMAFSDSLRNSMIKNLVSEWKLDENTGTTATDAWGSNEGTLVNNPTWNSGSECVSGSCLEFDGTDDYIDCGNDSSFDITENITIEAWVKPMGQSGAVEHIVSKASAYYIRYLDSYNFNGTIYISGSPRSIVSSSPLETNVFSHVLLTYDGENIKAYINGIEETPVSQTGLIDSNTSTVHIGGPGADGIIDEVRIYNQALSTSQIQQNYLAGLDSLLVKQAITQQEYDNRLNNLNEYVQN